MKTPFTDLGIFAQAALRHMSQHCPKMLESKERTGEIDQYLAMIDEEVPEMIQELYQQLKENNPLPEKASYLDREHRNNWLMRTASHQVTKEMIYFRPESEISEPEIDEMEAWNQMLPEMDDEDLDDEK